MKATADRCPACGAALAARISIPSRRLAELPRPASLLPILLLAVTVLLLVLGKASVDDELLPDPTANPSAVGPGVGPLPEYETLARRTGVTAVVLTRTRLELVDLDTATRDFFILPHPVRPDPGGVGRMMLARDRSLLVPNGRGVWSIDLTSGSITDLGPGDRVAPALDEGYAWLLDAEEATWREIDPAGRTLRTMPWPSTGIPWDHGEGAPELAAASGGGLYRMQDDGSWLFVAEGTPLAGNSWIALVQSCDSLTDCTHRWIDLNTGLAIERWLPPTLTDPGLRRYRLSPHGNSLIEMNPTDRSWEAVYAYGDGTVRGTACHQGWRSAAWSDDESLLACVTDRGVAVTDIHNGPAALFDDWRDPPLAVVLVNSTTVSLGR